MDDQTDIHRLAVALIANAQDLARELDWLATLLEVRLKTWFAEPSQSPPLPLAGAKPPALDSSSSTYANFLAEHDFSAAERLIVALALAPHLRCLLYTSRCV